VVFNPQICVGQVMHRRLRPVEHAFVYPVFYMLLPLRNMDSARCSLFSINRRNVVSFQDKDHGPRDGSPLLPWIEAVLIKNGLPADGPIMLQTFPRVLGFVFNPVSFWYCHNTLDQLVAVLAEVNNTFGGTHSYLLHQGGKPLVPGDELSATKCFHVSPFNTITGSYIFRFRPDQSQQVACIDYLDSEGPLLLTSISGKPSPLRNNALLSAFLKMPLMTAIVYLRIHWQAFRLWSKGVHFFGANPVCIPPRN